MITHKTLIACITLACSFFQANALAEETRMFHWQLGLEHYSETYEEFHPITNDIFMQETAFMYGMNLGMLVRLSEQLSLTNKFRMAHGTTTYTGALQSQPYGSFKATGHTRDVAEIRSLLTYSLTPDHYYFAGVGLRLLTDNLQQIGPVGYKRISSYLYVPVGMTHQWHIGSLQLAPTVVFNYLVAGKQLSYLEDSTVAHKQPKGYGFELLIPVSPLAYHDISLTLTPYLKFWHIEKSEEVIVRDTSTQKDMVTMEPRNTTTEVGVQINLTF